MFNQPFVINITLEFNLQTCLIINLRKTSFSENHLTLSCCQQKISSSQEQVNYFNTGFQTIIALVFRLLAFYNNLGSALFHEHRIAYTQSYN